METLQIKKEAALTAHDNAKNSGRKLLEDLFGKNTFIKDIKERIKTFNDVLEYHKIDTEDFEESCAGLTSDEVAYKQLKLIISALNEGWTPDWTNSSEYKYFAWFEMGSSSGGFSYGGYGTWCSVSDVGSRLCLKSSVLAKFAGTQFENIYKEFLTL